ncbi:hypothetical protein BJY04DRAFT_210974 [Aspergillus karnatakaensis]|uniref:uncharacterized protein n=1 Tax=Aspergillus karnatakaensis TaxID=1810916 RepID=UPI003CCDF8C0
MDNNDSDTYPAPYGRACANCSQSKCKCIYPRAGGRCQRCQRLNKECRQPTSHKRQSTRKTAASKSAVLEQKLEDLVSLLRAGVQPPGVNAINAFLPASSNQATDNPTNSQPTPAEWLEATISRSNLPSVSQSSTEHTPNTTASEASSQTTVSFSSPAEPKGLEAEEYLTLFQIGLLPYFPCVHIPLGKTAHQLRRDRPFTWLCIMSVVCRPAEQRSMLNDKIKVIVAQHMIHDSTNTNIDILHGLLIYLGWSNQHVHNKANIHVFTQLVQAGVYELGLHKPMAKPKMMALCVHTEEDEMAVPAGQTLEERRAILAAFFITSIISTFVQRSVSLRWTPFMDECVKSLEEEKECPFDEILVQQVRLQLITDMLDSSPYQGGLTSTPSPIKAPPAFYLQSMHAQLRSVQSQILPDNQHHKIILLHQHYASLTLHESALTNAAILSTNVNFQQLEYLYACLEAAKSWFDVFLAIQPLDYVCFPFSIFAQLVHNLVMLFQLSTLNDPGWDTAAVRQKADILAILSTIIENMGRVAGLAGLEGGPDSDVFSRIAKIYQTILVMWEVKLAPDLFPQPVAESTHAMPANFPLASDHAWVSDMVNSITQGDHPG